MTGIVSSILEMMNKTCRRNLSFIVCVFALLICLEGCAGRDVVVDTYLNQSAVTQDKLAGATLAILQNEETVNPLFDKEVKQKITALLKRQGYRLGARRQADYFVRYGYDIEGEERTTLTPVHPHDYYDPYDHHYYMRGSSRFDRDYHRGLGYTTYVHETYTLYIATFRMRVIDADVYRKEGDEKIVWIGETYTESFSSDLRELIDYLIASTFQYFGQDTKVRKTVTVSPDDEFMQTLKGTK